MKSAQIVAATRRASERPDHGDDHQRHRAAHEGDGISQMGRATRGVRVVNLEEGDSVAAWPC